MNILRLGIVWLLSGVVVLGGCAQKKKQITERDRKEATLLVDEAKFALTVRDWKRAEGLLAKAAELSGDADVWLGVGSTRVRLGDRGGAKDAYQTALKAFEDAAARDGTAVEPWLNQAKVLALLGRLDDSKAVLAKAAKRFPNDTRLKTLLDPKQFEQMVTSPGFKEIAL